jgi:hypothetical protein
MNYKVFFMSLSLGYVTGGLFFIATDSYANTLMFGASLIACGLWFIYGKM